MKNDRITLRSIQWRVRLQREFRLPFPPARERGDDGFRAPLCQQCLHAFLPAADPGFRFGQGMQGVFRHGAPRRMSQGQGAQVARRFFNP